MQRQLIIYGFIDEKAQVVPIIDAVGNFLNSNNAVTVHLYYPQAVAKNLEAPLTRNKHIAKLQQDGKLVLNEMIPDTAIFNQITIQPDSFYWLMNAEYFAQAPAIYRWFDKADEAAVYTLSPPAQKSKLGTRIALRLFNTARAKGLENNFIAFHSSSAETFFNLTHLTPQNFSYRIATYAALAGLPLNEADVAVLAKPHKVGWFSSAQNAMQNRWKWMVGEPLKALKEKMAGSIWQGNHPLWRLVFFAIAVSGLILFPILSFSYGITWDERGDAEYAELVLHYYTSFGGDISCFTEAKDNNLYAYLRYYGPEVNLISAFVAGFSPFGLYETRHIVGSIIGFLGIIYAGRIAKLLGNWQAGVMAMLVLMVSPVFYGHIFNNLKDIPFAAGYIISLYYLICFVRELPNPSRKTLLFCVLAFGFTIGVRIGGLLLPAYMAMCLGLYWLFNLKNPGVKKSLPRFIKYTIVIALGSYIFGIILWPYALVDPIHNPFRSLTEFTNFSGILNYELFEGKKLYIADKPWYYIPKYISIQTPLFVFAGILFFLFLVSSSIKNKNLWFLLLLVFAAVFPVVYAIIQHSSVYNGWRHFLFVYPPLAILAALGWQWLAGLFGKSSLKLAVLGLFTVNIIYITFWMIKSHPNQYVYFNELAGGTKGAYSYYETDYYSNSMKQAADWFAKHVGTKEPYIISSNNEPLTAEYYLRKKNPAAQVLWTKDYDLHTKPADYEFITTRTMSHFQLTRGVFPPKGTIHTISVDGIPLLAIVKRENNYQPLGDKYYEDKKFDSAIYYAAKAVEYDSNNVEALRLLAKSFIAKDSLPPAYALLKRSLYLFPDDYMGLELMGEVFFRKKDNDSAAWYFKQSIAERINYSKAYINFGVVRFNQKRYNEAIDNFNLAVKYSDRPKADQHCYLAKTYLAMKQYDKAIQAGNNALKADPNYPDAYLTLASIYQEMGNEEQANAMYTYYMKLTGQL